MENGITGLAGYLSDHFININSVRWLACTTSCLSEDICHVDYSGAFYDFLCDAKNHSTIQQVAEQIVSFHLYSKPCQQKQKTSSIGL